MHRSARTVSASLGEVEHFLVDALTGHGGIPVNQHWKYLLLGPFAAPMLTRVRHTDDNRVDDFEMRRIESQRQMAGAPRGRYVGRVAQVVLDVAGGQILRLLAFELVKQHCRFLAQRIDQNIQTSTMRHTDHDVVDS